MSDFMEHFMKEYVAKIDGSLTAPHLCQSDVLTANGDLIPPPYDGDAGDETA